MIKRTLMKGNILVGEFEATGDHEKDSELAFQLLKEKGMEDITSKPEQIFGLANAFGHISFVIHRRYLEIEPPDMTGVSPYIVNATLAIELFLKALKTTQGKTPQGHNLLNLYLSLNKSLIAVITGYGDGLRAKYKIDHSREFEKCLQSIGNAFVNWRYIYEHEKLSIDLGELQFVFETLSRSCNEIFQNNRKEVVSR